MIIQLPKGSDVGKVTGSVDGFVGVIVGLFGAIGVIGFVIQYSLRQCYNRLLLPLCLHPLISLKTLQGI